MRLLILGGTKFVGRHLAEQALDRGWQVTLFNRGRTGPELFPTAERLVGDRATGDYAALQGRSWDAVIDTCAYRPREVEQSLEVLAGAVGHATLISTLSVFGDPDRVDQDEDGRLATWPEDGDRETVTGESYGPLKVLCEEAFEARLGATSLVVRPGLIVGPDDPTDRFTYWPVKLARQSEVLAPGPRDLPVQFIDVRDLARFTLDGVERNVNGRFNVVGPNTPTTIGQMLDEVNAAVGGSARLVWVDGEFLAEHQVQPWADLPLWIPRGAGMDGFATFVCAKARSHGLQTRPIGETARDTWEWFRSRRNDPLTAGIPAEREAELLSIWRS